MKSYGTKGSHANLVHYTQKRKSDMSKDERKRQAKSLVVRKPDGDAS